MDDIIDYIHGLASAVRKCIHIEITRKSNLIHEKEWTDDMISSVCKKYDYMPIYFWDRLSRSINSN
jgi:hypothetical protein